MKTTNLKITQQTVIKLKNRNTRKRCKVCSKLTIKNDVNDVVLNFGLISHLFLTLSREMFAGDRTFECCLYWVYVVITQNEVSNFS